MRIFTSADGLGVHIERDDGRWQFLCFEPDGDHWTTPEEAPDPSELVPLIEWREPTTGTATKAALTAARRALLMGMDEHRQAAERRMGLEPGAPEAIDDPTYDAMLGAWTAWTTTTDAVEAAIDAAADGPSA